MILSQEVTVYKAECDVCKKYFMPHKGQVLFFDKNTLILQMKAHNWYVNPKNTENHSEIKCYCPAHYHTEGSALYIIPLKTNTN